MSDLLPTILLLGTLLGLGAWRPRWARAPTSQRILLVIWHTLWCLGYWELAKTSVADASVYLANGAVAPFVVVPGTRFITSLSVLLVQYLDLSPLNCYLAFSIPGALGLLLLQQVLWEVGSGNRTRHVRLAQLLVWLPGLSFWSVAPGKDGLALLAICAAIHGSLDLSGRWRWLIFGAAVMFMVRPHMASLVLVAGVGAHVMRGRQDRGQLVVLAVLLAAVTYAVPFTMEYVGLAGLQSTDDLTAYVEHRQGYNMEGGSSVDIADMNPLLRLPTFMFRPLFLDAQSLTSLAASVENLILVLFCAMALRRAVRASTTLQGFGVRFCLVYGLMGWLVLSQLTANLGIAVRQKVMILPAIFTLGVMALAAPAERRTGRLATRPGLSPAA